MTSNSNIQLNTTGLFWLKSGLSLKQDILSEIKMLDSSKIVFDLSSYNTLSKFKLSKISRGLHSKKFNDFITSHIQNRKYPILVKDILKGKITVSEGQLYDLSLKIASDHELLSDFVVYSLVKELEAVDKLAKSNEMSLHKSERLESMVLCFDIIYKNIFSSADQHLKEILIRRIQIDSDIMNLVEIQPKSNRLNGAYMIFGFAVLFVVCYSIAFYFIDPSASALAIQTIFQ